MMGKFYIRLRRKICSLAKDVRGVERWSNILSTHEILPLLKSRFNPDIPPVVNLETNTDCNYKCPFCPQSSSSRPIRYITLAGFRLVVEELKNLDNANLLVLSVNNEPFLHPLIIDFCRILSEELPRSEVSLISNGSLITQEHLKILAGLQNPPHLTVDDYTPDHHINKRLRDWLSDPVFSDFHFMLKDRSREEKLSNRAGNQPGCESNVGDFHDIVCAWPFEGLFINSELKAFLCCSDYSHDTIVGDLNTQHLMDIWKGDKLNSVREALLVPDRSQVSICSRCDADWTHLPEHCR